ncbi:MAG: XisI protein [Bacteroidota bacterium]
MEKLKKYKKIVVQLFEEQAAIRSSRENIETQFNKDEQQNHFQLVNIGWMNRVRVYGCFLHIDIKPDGKVWLQHDGTDIEVANILVKRGIPKEDIVLAFHPERLRHHTGFAIS